MSLSLRQEEDSLDSDNLYTSQLFNSTPLQVKDMWQWWEIQIQLLPLVTLCRDAAILATTAQELYPLPNSMPSGQVTIDRE